MDDTKLYLKYLCDQKDINLWKYLEPVYDKSEVYELKLAYGTVKNFVNSSYQIFLNLKNKNDRI